METRRTPYAERQTEFAFASGQFGADELANRRLDVLLAANSQTAREKSVFRTEQEKSAAELMENPWSTAQTFAYFGLLLGVFPPLAMFIKFFSEKGVLRGEDFWIFGVVAIINLISATVGYFSGKMIGRVVVELEKLSWTKMLLISPFVGIVWGILAGGAGGAIVFLIGAIFGAALGAMVGSVALPVFVIFHRWLKKGDSIERKHFLPIGFGIALMIFAFILGS